MLWVLVTRRHFCPFFFFLLYLCMRSWMLVERVVVIVDICKSDHHTVGLKRVRWCGSIISQNWKINDSNQGEILRGETEGSTVWIFSWLKIRRCICLICFFHNSDKVLECVSSGKENLYHLMVEMVKIIRAPGGVRRPGLHSATVTHQCWDSGLSQKTGPLGQGQGLSSTWSCAAGHVGYRKDSMWLPAVETDHLPCHFSGKKEPRWGEGSVNTLNYVLNVCVCVDSRAHVFLGKKSHRNPKGVQLTFRRRIPIIGVFVCVGRRGCLYNVVENPVNSNRFFFSLSHTLAAYV